MFAGVPCFSFFCLAICSGASSVSFDNFADFILRHTDEALDFGDDDEHDAHQVRARVRG